MSFDDVENQSLGGDLLKALIREDLDVYSVEDLKARMGVLQAEIERAQKAIEAKSSQRNAADALFNFGN